MPEPVNTWAIASFSGIVEVTATQWIDVIKVKMQQLSLTGHNASFSNAVRTIYRNGLLSFYAGYLPRLCGIVPMRCVYWGTMNTMNELMKDSNHFAKILLAPLVVGLVQTCVDNPIEVLKIRQITGGKLAFNSLTNGFTATLCRNMLFALPVSYSIRTYGTENPFLAGAIGGVVGSIISQPLDVAKTELQRYKTSGHPHSTFSVLKTIYSISPRNLMVGAVMRSTLGFCNMGIGYCVFSYAHKYFNSTACFDTD